MVVFLFVLVRHFAAVTNTGKESVWLTVSKSSGCDWVAPLLWACGEAQHRGSKSECVTEQS
jgi:hypothetical protein